MTAKSRRIEICPRCLDLRIRDVDFEAEELTVHLPQTCQFKVTCRGEMRQPYETFEEPQR